MLVLSFLFLERLQNPALCKVFKGLIFLLLQLFLGTVKFMIDIDLWNVDYYRCCKNMFFRDGTKGALLGFRTFLQKFHSATAKSTHSAIKGILFKGP